METPNNRYRADDPGTWHDMVLVQPNRFAQSSEINEIQSLALARERRALDALFADGSVIAGAQLSVNPVNGEAAVTAGRVYLAGQVRDTAAAAFTVPVQGAQTVGLYLLRQTITHQENPRLRGQDPTVRGYNEPGADRIHISLQWGLQGSGQAGDFYGVWQVVDGHVQPREPSAQQTAIANAIARYDRDSAGGAYVIEGLQTIALPDLPDGRQVYNVTAGRARVGGNAVELLADRRVQVRTAADTATIDAEPKLSQTADLQSISFDRWPADTASVRVRIVKRKTADIVHGGFAGVADPLPDNAVLTIESVTQGGNTYQQGSDWLFSANQIDWAPGGQEPAPGSTYQVTYQYKTQVTPENLTPYGFDVRGAVVGSLIESTYEHKLRRIDSLIMDSAGALSMVRGVPDTWAPRPPDLPAGQLALAHIHQRWDDGRRVELAAVRVVPMSTLVDYDTRLDNVARQMAELRLAVAVAGRYSGIKAGQFADPMQDDAMRDAGAPQTGVISGGWLQLPGGVDATALLAMSDPLGMAHELGIAIEQPCRTGALHINGSSRAAAQTPATLTLTPAADRWGVGHFSFSMSAMNIANPAEWVHASPDQLARYNQVRTDADVIAAARQALLQQPKQQARHTMRETFVTLDITGFKAGESVEAITIGGLPAVVSVPSGKPAAAGADGALQITSRVPAGIPTGTVPVIVRGSHGTQASAMYEGVAFLSAVAMWRVNNRNGNQGNTLRKVEIDV